MDGLAALVRETLGSDPYRGVIYVFRAKRADRVKLLLWDGTGLVLVRCACPRCRRRFKRRDQCARAGGAEGEACGRSSMPKAPS
jgi:transposase